MKRPTLPARRVAASALLAATLAVACGGCDFQPADIPVPGTGVGGPTYHLRIEFADVLNLPQGAKVIVDGVRVGRLTRVTLVDPVAAAPNRPAHKGYVIADVDISSAVRLPVGTTAEMQQETPLGDVHIELTEPAASRTGSTTSDAAIAPDATIPLTDTKQSPPIEDILARLSTFVGSGAITDIQAIVHKMNGILPRDPKETARIAATLGFDLGDLADHTNSIHEVVNGISSTVEDGLLKNTPTLDPLLTPEGVQHTTDVMNAEIGVIFVLTALGPMASTTKWLGPVVGSLDNSVHALVPMLFGAHPLDAGSPSNYAKLVDLIQNKLIPFVDRGPKLNMVGVSLGPAPAAAMSPDEQTGRIVDTLRMIGVVR
ncbi:MlaD family protein [Nocardia jiangxiensis]|uniref:MlaD family protein n=1 Tax=Nocardia jiangxiensis TaxID=282685 RepID=UPI0002F7AEA7|nr:MlaD family protein [Nocardia jiangxiensis]